MRSEITNLNNLPELQDYLDSEPADSHLLEALSEGDNYFCELSTGIHTGLSLVQVLALYGKTDHIRLIASVGDIKSAVKAGDYKAIQLAAENGHLDTLQELEKHLSRTEKNKPLIQKRIFSEDEKREVENAIGLNAFKYVAQNGHGDVCEHFAKHIDKDKIVAEMKKYNFVMMREVVEGNDLDVVRELFPAYLSEEEIVTGIRSLDYKFLEVAAQQGHLDMFIEISRYLNDDEMKEAICPGGWSYMANQAIENGHLNMLKHLKSHLTLSQKK